MCNSRSAASAAAVCYALLLVVLLEVVQGKIFWTNHKCILVQIARETNCRLTGITLSGNFFIVFLSSLIIVIVNWRIEGPSLGHWTKVKFYWISCKQQLLLNEWWIMCLFCKSLVHRIQNGVVSCSGVARILLWGAQARGARVPKSSRSESHLALGLQNLRAFANSWACAPVPHAWRRHWFHAILCSL